MNVYSKVISLGALPAALGARMDSVKQTENIPINRLEVEEKCVQGQFSGARRDASSKFISKFMFLTKFGIINSSPETRQFRIRSVREMFPAASP